jgi:hypothetical protein
MSFGGSSDKSGSGEKGSSGRGVVGLLPRLLAAYAAGGDESIDAIVEGVSRDIAAGCRLANGAVVASASAPASAADGGTDDDADADAGADGGEDAGVTDTDRARIRLVLSTLYYVNQVLSASTVVCRALESGAEGKDAINDDDLAAGIARFSAPDPEEANRVQQLLLYLLNAAQVRGYRRRHGEMYRRQRADAEDHDTHAWERVCDMRDFVYENTRKEVRCKLGARKRATQPCETASGGRR